MWAEDGAEEHGKRLGDWIIEKMGGEGKPWTESGRWGERTPSHFKGWHNSKRLESVRGDAFDTEDVMLWYAIMFMSVR